MAAGVTTEEAAEGLGLGRTGPALGRSGRVCTVPVPVPVAIPVAIPIPVPVAVPVVRLVTVMLAVSVIDVGIVLRGVVENQACH